MTWGEFSYTADGYALRDIDMWKKFRMIALMQYNTHAKRAIKDPEQFMPLESKKKKPNPRPSGTKAETLQKVAKELYGRR